MTPLLWFLAGLAAGAISVAIAALWVGLVTRRRAEEQYWQQFTGTTKEADDD